MKIRLDLQAHAWAGLAIMLTVSLFFGWGFGLAVAIAAGVGKEIRDYLGHGTPDHWDAVATAAGGAVGAILYGIRGLL
jgi:hypothetical protein